MIFGPDGKALCEPIGVGEEAIIKADIDLRDIDYAKTVRGPDQTNPSRTVQLMIVIGVC